MVGMFERIGDILPRFDLYIRLFPGHSQLLDAMSRVYSDIVRFCLKARQVFKNELIPRQRRCKFNKTSPLSKEMILLAVLYLKSDVNTHSPYRYKCKSRPEELLE